MYNSTVITADMPNFVQNIVLYPIRSAATAMPIKITIEERYNPLSMIFL